MKWMHRISGIIAAACLLSVVQTAQAVTDTFAVSGIWTAPAGVTSVDVEV